ncbi:MAG: hypothetical protein GQE15_34680 [Archangiaceae bacterium]|nr:hypothetical protein [Archangiaceae bacterium]
MRPLLPLLLVATVSACSPFKSVLADAPDVLTAGGEDPLFTITLDPGGFNADLIGVAANLPNETQTILSCVGTEPSPAVWVETCFEPRTNLFDETTIGKPVRVELFAERWPSRRPDFTLEFLTWVPQN